MARCSNCGRKGLFFKVNSTGLCKDCMILRNLEDRKLKLEADIESKQTRLSEIQSTISSCEDRLASLIAKSNQQEAIISEYESKRDEIYNIIKGQAEVAAIANVKDQIDELENKRLEKSDEIDKITASFNAMKVKYYVAKIKYDSYRGAKSSIINPEAMGMNTEYFYSMLPTFTIELNCLTVKQLRKLFNENKANIQSCFSKYSNRYSTKTNAALYKLMTIALEAELQNALYVIGYGKLESSIENIQMMCAKYYQIAVDGNQTIAPTIKSFIGEIEVLFTEAIKIEYEYYVQKERIKEEQRAIREQMRQEAEERKALEQERKRIEREEQKYRNEIEKIREQMKTAEANKIQALTDRIAELESQIQKVEEKREQIVNLENGKAGYVYIISNIGSFGEDVYKIGMTRRMEPMERINELGNASVPFPFDVHGMIFSDDAVSLERDLHTLFNDQRVNKVNLRKEFFKVSLDNIEKVVDERCPSAEFRRTALAEQYRQSLTMTQAAAELDVEDFNFTQSIAEESK